MLRKIITNETRDTIELNNRVVIEIHTAAHKSVRGYSCAAVIADEVAFWPSDTDSASCWPRLLTLDQAARYVGLGPASFRTLYEAERIRPVRIPRDRSARDCPRNGRDAPASDELRVLRFDRRDLDRLVDTWRGN